MGCANRLARDVFVAGVVAAGMAVAAGGDGDRAGGADDLGGGGDHGGGGYGGDGSCGGIVVFVQKAKLLPFFGYGTFPPFLKWLTMGGMSV